MTTLLRDKVAPGTRTVGGFTDLRYPPSEPSHRAWRGRWERTVRISANTDPAWIGPVVAKLNRLLALADDWDPRGSRAVRLHDIEDAVEFLNVAMNFDSPAPAITPLPSGGLELAWTVDGTELEVIFDSTEGERTALLHAAGEETELSPEDALMRVDFLGQKPLVAV